MGSPFVISLSSENMVRAYAVVTGSFSNTTGKLRSYSIGLQPPQTPKGRFSSHNAWGTDHFGFMYQGDLEAFCEGLRAKGVRFPVPLKRGVGGSLLCYVAAPDGVSIELMQC